MTDLRVDEQAAEQATALQRKAARPDQSVFVSANAGTGKTQVLTMRVLRLLLSGAPADTILCLTYTKAAAAEMRHRLNKELAQWAICKETELHEALVKLGIERPTQKQIYLARSLFAQILDNDEGPMIETVHSFCQSVLMRFPIEAGIAPQFELISDYDRTLLLTSCFHMLLQEAAAQPELPESKALIRLAAQSDEEQTLKRLTGFLTNRNHAHKMATDFQARQAFTQHLSQEVGLFDPEKLPELTEKLLADLDRLPLEKIATMLKAGGITQQKRAEKIFSWVQFDTEQRIRELPLLIEAFLTREGVARKALTDKPIEAAHPTCLDLQNPVLALVLEYQYRTASALCFELTSALTDAGVQLYKRFQNEKAKRGVLDYDDLIFLTEQLLSRHEIMAWVRWKLDRGINHLLVDEAQDTSPEQWALIRHLSAPFFDDATDLDSSEQGPRTFFAVGDFKQSIYSFQGARPQIFAQSRDDFSARLNQAKRPFSVVDFTLSFRSSRAILDFVDQLILQSNAAGLGEKRVNPHKAYHKDMAGLVELWPVIDAEPAAQAPYLDLPELSEGDDGPLRQAKKVVEHIKSLLEGAEFDHFGRTIYPQDILILVRKRDSFFALLRAELERAAIPVAGADRMALKNQIEILDLLALADICLLPEDDLQLACLLKSPLIGLDEEALFSLATSRAEKSLFDTLIAYLGSSGPLAEAAEKIIGWRQLSQRLPVFEFFSVVLSQGGRAAFHRRLGHAVDESLDAFLLRARDHGKQSEPGLSHFLDAFRQGDSEVKRDMDTAGSGEVRVMSIHGAKGLEAPIVYLPDMLSSRTPSDSLVTTEEAVYWPAGTPEAEFISNLKEDAKLMRNEEADRLLYVALTRAKQALFISGWRRKNSRTEEGSWYERLTHTIQACEGAIETDQGVWRLASGKAAPEKALERMPQPVSSELPDWLEKQPKEEPVPARPLAPSDPGMHDQTTPFQASNRKNAVKRGQFSHRLFEILPNLDAENRMQAAYKIADIMGLTKARFGQPPPLSEAEITALVTDVKAVMAMENLHPLFADDALAETTISGLVGGIAVQGQIDRLVVTEKKVMVADFKTGLPPASPEAIPQSYIRQMALYGHLVGQIYLDKEVECMLIWTQNLSVSIISEVQRTQLIEQLIAGQTK